MATATYNWSIKPNVTNKWNITVPSTADDVRPTNFSYVAHFGNDTTGNGSRKYPFKTYAKACSATANYAYVIFATGVYREAYPASGAATGAGINLVGDGTVVIDVTLINAVLARGQSGFNLYNITVRGGTAIGSNPVTFADVFSYAMGNSGFVSKITDSVFRDATIIPAPVSAGDVRNVTFYRCQFTTIGTPAFQSMVHCIFVECNINIINIAGVQAIDYSIFWNCNFRFGTSSAGATFYPLVPTGYSYLNTLSGIQAASVTAYGSSAYNFNNCSVVDPLFNNVAINDFSLQPTSTAKNRSYFGFYAGAYSIATAIKVDTSALTSGFDNSSAVNLTIANNSLTLTDVNQNAQITAKPVANLIGRDVARFPVSVFNADRNGEVVDTASDLSASTISAGTNLTAATPYIVEVAAITYNATVYSAGQRFTSTSAGGDTFTTAGGGVVREILEAPSRQGIEARFSDGAASPITSGALTAGSWYYVESGSATYNGNTYAAGSFFLVVGGTTSFTGTTSLREAITSSDTYYTFEINQKPTTNNTGNVRTGSVIRGNADKDFDRTAANVFPVNKKFIQLRYTIQVNNLIP